MLPVCSVRDVPGLYHDEGTLRSYGPYSYQIHDLLGRQGKEVSKRQVA